MKKCSFAVFLIIFLTKVSFGQEQKIENKYFDYSQIRMNKTRIPDAIKQALALLERSKDLTKSQLGSVNYHLGRLYEESGDTLKAVPFYEKSIEIIPDYYVPYLALGYKYFNDCKILIKKMNIAADARDLALHTKITIEYKKLADKALIYLEKAQACDPDEQTIKMINYLYRTTKNNTGLATLNDRLIKLSTNCITVLED